MKTLTTEDLIVLAEWAIDALEQGKTATALANLHEIRASLVNKEDIVNLLLKTEVYCGDCLTPINECTHGKGNK